MQVPKRRSEKFQKVDDGPIRLTKEGLEKLQEELAKLKHFLPGYIAEAQRTAAYGDRSDNAEYKQAKGTLRRTNYRILEIEDQLKRVELIVPSAAPAAVVRIGSTVTVVLKNGVERTFQILGPQEADPTAGKISDQSPLGAALMGKKKDDVLNIQAPNGSQEYRIAEIS